VPFSSLKQPFTKTSEPEEKEVDCSVADIGIGLASKSKAMALSKKVNPLKTDPGRFKW